MHSSDSAAEHFDQLRKRWEIEQVISVLLSNSLGAIIGNLLNISLVGFLLIEIYPGAWLVTWLAFGLSLNAFRLALYLFYKRRPGQYRSAVWLRVYRITTFLSGLHFGVLALFFFSSIEPLYQTLVACFICGSVAAAVGTHGVDATTYRLFLFPSAVPLLFRAASEGTEIHSALAVMVLFLIIVMMRCANQTQRTMLDNIQMSYSLNYRATHDPLVALYNREEFRSEFNKTRTLAVNEDKLTTLVFIDLDNFKQVNDSHGHEAGDKALIRIGEIIRASIRKSDVAARFGGDEFILLLYVNSTDDAFLVCDKILRAINVARHDLEGADKLGASLGIGYTRDGKVSFESLLRAADAACYDAKSKGKGQVSSREAEREGRAAAEPASSLA
ncbi:hypothetical protein A3742_07965 [Oleiphilus sp. HI0071]|uniref:GGDEF domain-containing protein n=1 Tax=unclassified Oleiphilus TaxID=2631174 RepID=UPI0007C24FD4|nr:MULTISPECIES: GGDEF domain-containing protein [unclassified Oleiphilus]KZY72610.1 hypothetical protein A3737_10930 [Oleiphilus sp. HI0065]KZY82811.1 hypothetical protein A3742_07965 [Oleiphilus sp. HI0071]KZZ04878.1 hypothetical protein A3744_09405 [Oleiphilus sp. HI0073]KZZ40233.1 hypothetical protein A3758_24505 [Oleiphilus sp. HI0118]KZZ56657.1 hypothetical protein A3760_08425 [Oleiphilus sp. HI0122]KZZ70994.1 hypothetical protein A3765_15505 [Oleiphilus sp. HI0130]KZZ80868.1 hypotheti